VRREGDSVLIAATELDLVEDALRRTLASNVSLLSEAAEQLILSGGKRLRPRVVLLAYKAAGGRDVSQAVPMAAVVELVHTASLIHDDINDQSNMRRGQETINAQWGDSLALIAGDFVFVRMLSLIAAFDTRILQVLADACLDIVEGETLQVLSLGDTGMAEKLYLEIVSKKTAALFSACAEMGGILAAATEQQVDALRDYGLNLGIAFQIRDDTLDLVGERDDLGKPVISDLKQGRMSLATLFALKRSKRAREMLISKDTTQVIELLRHTGALEYAMQRAKEYSDRAKVALSVLPESEARAALCDWADFAVARDM
jgi:octaprenyl-diphosphate synthase